MSMTDNMDSVFANCTADEQEFDTIFDTEDSLIDTVAGVNESGDPITGVDFEDLHQTEDEATVKDVQDELGPDHDEKLGAPNPEGSKEAEVLDTSVKNSEINKDSDADKFYGDAEEEYQDQKDSTAKVDDSSVTDTIEKTVDESTDECEDCDRDIDAELNDDGDGDDSEVQESAEEDDRDIDAELNADEDDDDVDSELNEAGKVKDADDSEDDDIESVANEKIGKKASTDLSYDIEDEELLDLVLNGKA